MQGRDRGRGSRDSSLHLYSGMDMLIEYPGIMVAALLLASLLGGVMGFMLRGWYDDARGADDPSADAAPGAWRNAPDERRTRGTDSGWGVKRTALPASASQRVRDRWRNPEEGVPADRTAENDEGPLVLLVDDRLELLALHSAYLHEHGYRVLTAGDGETGLEYARTHHPDVMVVDHSMPRRTGLEVARELKRDPKTADIPILMMTAHSYGAVGTAAKEAGCETFLPKPVDPSRMLREVAIWAAPFNRR